jgi:hypothetical protein
MKASVALSLAIAAVVSGAVIAQTSSMTREEALAYEISLKNTPQANSPAQVLASVSYSDTTVGGPETNRSFADCSGISGLGPVTYHAQLFHVGTTGAHNISSIQDGFDGYIHIYSPSFDPADAMINCVIGDDDGDGGIGTSDIDAVELTAGVQYVLVTEGFELGEEGTFTNTIDGPGAVTLGALGGGLPDPVPQPNVIPSNTGKSLGLMAVLLSLVGFAVLRRRG